MNPHSEHYELDEALAGALREACKAPDERRRELTHARVVGRACLLTNRELERVSQFLALLTEGR